MKLRFDRSQYLSNPDVFEAHGLDEVDHELCEFNNHIEDIAYELAYTRYALAKAEAKLHNIEEGLRMLDEMLKDRDSLKFFGREGICIEILDPYKCIEAPTLSDLIDAILTGGE